MYPIIVRSQWIFEQRSSSPSQIIHIMKRRSYLISVGFFCFLLLIIKGEGRRGKMMMSGFTKKEMTLNHSI